MVADASSQSMPDWSSRMPGEQWVLLDSMVSAEAYLATYPADQARIVRENWPNSKGLYARVSFPGRIAQDRVYIAPEAAQE